MSICASFTAFAGILLMFCASDKSSNFGYQMLMKMGWKEGGGLGKNEDGIATHVKVDKRTDNLGIGATIDLVGSEGWSATRSSFGDLLASLNQEFTGKFHSFTVNVLIECH